MMSKKKLAIPMRKPLSEEEKAYEKALQDEDELKSLKTTAIVLERKRCAMSMLRPITHIKLKNVLKKESQNVNTALKVINSAVKRNEFFRILDELRKMLSQYDDYKRKIKVIRDYLAELENQIYLKEREVLELKSRQLTDRQHFEKNIRAKRTLENLEKKLDVQYKQFGMICTENKMLRQTITDLICLRTRFNQNWQSLIKKIVKGKHFMLDLIRQAKNTFEEREEWVIKLRILRQKANRDMMIHNSQMRQLDCRADNNKKLHTFLTLKSTRRAITEIENRLWKRKQERVKELEDTVTHYHSILNEISEFKGERSIQDVSKMYIEQEFRNFSMFMRIVDVNTHIEELCEEVNKNYEKINENKEIIFAIYKKQIKTISDLRKKLAQQENDTNAAIRQHKDVENYLEKIFQSLGRLFKICNCDEEEAQLPLEAPNKITHFNAMSYVRVLEKTIHHYIQHHLIETLPKVSTVSQLKSSPKIKTIESIIKADPCPVCMERKYVTDLVLCAQRVWTKEEIKEYFADDFKKPALFHRQSKCNLSHF